MERSSNRKELDDHSGKLVAALLENDRHKTEFLATLAHELRNPLAPIKYALESMGLMELDDEVEDLRQMMARQVAQMVHLIDDLMDVSRINRGKIVLQKEVVSLRSIVESAVEASSILISENGQTIEVTNRCPNEFVSGDSSRLTQVVCNLLNNAAKYSGHGCHIDVIVSSEDGVATVCVQDNGIGIAAEHLEEVFKLFAQVGQSVERGTTGLGIGLTLVKTLVEMHGGTVVAQSDGANQGCAFTVRLPTVKAFGDNIAVALNPIIPDQSRSFRVLIVDDQRALRMVMKSLLEKLGHTVSVAESGSKALAMLDCFVPEIVFSDVSMPGMNGYEFARQLRQREGMNDVYLVAVTGSGQSIDRDSALAAGFDEHLIKPVGIQRLKALFASRSQVIK